MFLSINIGAIEKSNFRPSDFFETMSGNDKAAILMVHFGTTYNDTREKTIDAINRKVMHSFPDCEVREAYTSRIVMRRLRARGIDKKNPINALLKLRAEGYTHIIVQSTNVIEGIEMESLRRDVQSVKSFFKAIRIGTPLLYSAEDAKEVVNILGKRHPVKGNTVWVGHGTYTPATATYAMIDYMFKINGLQNSHVATIEGYPSFDELLIKLSKSSSKKVTLIPFMFVAGNHANNDISIDWKNDLEKEGYSVQVIKEGLGEVPEIQDMYINHIRFIMKNEMLDIIKKKAKYAQEKD